MHEAGYAIHRLMPPDRTIGFNIDRNSFRRGGVPEEVINIVISSAEEIASFIGKQDLGINFAHRPSSDPAVFDIRYDSRLPPTALAQSFFPSDPRARWKLTISRSVVTSPSNLYYLPNILAHEFAHILGLRHWNARTREAGLRSFHWPSTRRDSPRSVMVTGVHPSEVLFSAEDFRVIREIYSFPGGHVFAGREIIDVCP